MTYRRLAYDDLDTGAQMQADCAACVAELSFPGVDVSAFLEAAPSLAYDAFRTDLPKRGSVSVSEAAAHLGARLHLHLD